MKTKTQVSLKKSSKILFCLMLVSLLGASCAGERNTKFSLLPSFLTSEELAGIIGEENLGLVEGVVIGRMSPLSGYWSSTAPNVCFNLDDNFFLGTAFGAPCSPANINNLTPDKYMLTVQVNNMDPDFYIVARIEAAGHSPCIDPNEDPATCDRELGLWANLYYVAEKDANGNPTKIYSPGLIHVTNIAPTGGASFGSTPLTKNSDWEEYKTNSNNGFNWGTFIQDMKDGNFGNTNNGGAYTVLNYYDPLTP